MRAAQIAGLHVLRIINEPTAAGLSYAVDHPEKRFRADSRLLVFDFGGGTFDASVLVHDEDDVLDVLNTLGDQNMGGEDFTRRLYDHCLAEIERLKPGTFPTDEKYLETELYEKCTTLKHQLSL